MQDGERAFEAGNYAEAARLFEAAHKQSPRCDILFLLGMAQYRMKQVDAALISFQAAVQCDPKLTFAYLGLAEAYAERGSDEEAMAAEVLALLELPHPAASMTQPSAAAAATPVFFICTFPPPTCMTTLGQGREHRRGER